MKPAAKAKFRSLGLTALFCAGVYLVLLKSHLLLEHISFLRVEKVQIEAQWPLTDARVRAWIPPLEGRNILSVNASALIKQLSERPWVDAVTIKKEFPSRIRIDITTRRARAVRMFRGDTVFLDAQGKTIEPVTADMLKLQDLPVLSFETQYVEAQWDLSEVLQVFDTFQKQLSPKFRLSQLTLCDYPYFKTYLSSQPLEAEFSLETWAAQLPRLALLLNHPLEETRQTRRINLVLPKKAVVRNFLSH